MRKYFPSMKIQQFRFKINHLLTMTVCPLILLSSCNIYRIDNKTNDKARVKIQLDVSDSNMVLQKSLNKAVSKNKITSLKTSENKEDQK